jgi:signal transduction histidine kinase
MDSNKKLKGSEVENLSEALSSCVWDLSASFSELISPGQTMASILEYFEKAGQKFSAAFIFKEPDSKIFFYIKDRRHLSGEPVDIEHFSSFRKAMITDQPAPLNKKEALRLFNNPDQKSITFPISFQHHLFGFFLLNPLKEGIIPERDISRIHGFVKVIANSFYNSYLLKEIDINETAKADISKADDETNPVELLKNEALQEILPVVFHKLKNKLTPILGYAQILLSKLEDDSLKERIRRVEKNAEELTDLLNLLRGYFSGGQKRKQRENINGIIYRLNDYFNNIESSNNIKIKAKMDYTIADDLFIPGQLECLVINLVDNAVLAIKAKGLQNGVITLQTRQLKNSYKLTVRDNGIGINRDELPRIWAPFYSRFPDRPGLGLSTCERIIANHDAQFRFNSVEGEYTEFQVIFKNQLLQWQTTGMVVENDGTTFSGNILIADQEEYLLDLMKEMLIPGGNFEIMTTTSGEEAVSLINSYSFDLVITDFLLPQMGGTEMYNLLKSKKMENRIIMLTPDNHYDEIKAFLTKNRIKSVKKPLELLKFKRKVLEKMAKIQKSHREGKSKMV